jgi:hypothetical protein
MLTAVEGIYKDGGVELLERPEGLREARVIVIFLPLSPAGPSREEARNRMLNRMRAGIPLGVPPDPVREEIYEWDRPEVSGVSTSPFDVSPVSTRATTQDILEAIRESRERE